MLVLRVYSGTAKLREEAGYSYGEEIGDQLRDLLFERGSLRENQVRAPPFLDQALGVRSRCELLLVGG
jgi:hypothetical protein